MSVMRTIDTLFGRLMNVPFSPYLLVVVPIVIGCFRLALEHLWMPEMGSARMAVAFMVPHTLGVILFYALMQQLMAWAFALACSRKPEEMIGPVSVGLVIGWLPPLIDLLVPSEFEPGRYTYFFEPEWDLVAPYQSMGESVTLWLMIAVSGLFALWLTRSVWRAAAAALFAYVVVHIASWAWPEVAEAVARLSTSTGSVGPTATLPLINLVAIFALFVLHVVRRRHALWPCIVRVNHALPWGLVAAMAARIGGVDWYEALLRGFIMSFALQLVLIANDWLDKEQDASAGGSARPVGHEDYVVSIFLQILLGLWVLVFRPAGFYSIVLFLSLCTLYHLPPLRLKRLFCGAYKIEGFVAASSVLFGAQGSTFGSWLPVLVLLAIGGFSLGSMFKDYKDIDQDRAARVGTIYTRYMRKGYSLAGIHTFVRVSLSAGLLVPPIWLFAMAEPWPPAVGLIVLSAIIGGVCLGLRNRKLAVESALWCLDGYLLVLMLAVPHLR